MVRDRFSHGERGVPLTFDNPLFSSLLGGGIKLFEPEPWLEVAFFLESSKMSLESHEIKPVKV